MSAVDVKHLWRTAVAQKHSSGDVHGVSVKPSVLIALLDVAMAADAASPFVDCVTYGESEQIKASAALDDALAHCDFGDGS